MKKLAVIFLLAIFAPALLLGVLALRTASRQRMIMQQQEVELRQKGTELHAATVVGDTVGDPFKDTCSVALNPVIKFTTLFGLLAVELGVSMTEKQGATFSTSLAVAFLLVSMVFVWRSFYGMRIVGSAK